MGFEIAILAIGTASAIDQRNRAKRAEKKADERAALDRAISADSAARQRRQQVREQSLARARIANMAAAQGMQSSSAVIASSANVISQASENIGLLNTTQAGSGLATKLENDIFKLQQPSDLQYVEQVADKAYSVYGRKKK